MSQKTVFKPSKEPIVDFSKISSEGVELYMRDILQRAPDQRTINQITNDIAEYKATVLNLLQKSVFKNYSEFLCVSKEITQLEGDLINMRGLLWGLNESREKIYSETLVKRHESETCKQNYESPVSVEASKIINGMHQLGVS